MTCIEEERVANSILIAKHLLNTRESGAGGVDRASSDAMPCKCSISNHCKKYLGELPRFTKKKLAFTDHLVIFTIFGGWVGPPHSKNSKNY